MASRRSRSAHASGNKRPSPKSNGQVKPKAKLGIESLESRTLLAVTSQLTNNVLDVALSAANDAAQISIVNSQVDVFDGTTHVTYDPGQVQGISVHGTSAAKQSVALHSSLVLTKPLLVSQLAETTVDGSYQAKTIDLKSDSIAIKGGTLSTRTITQPGNPANAVSTGNSGDISLLARTIDVSQGGMILANATGLFLPGKVNLLAIDTQSGENLGATASISIKQGTIRGGDIVIDATANLTTTASQLLDAGGANLANLDVQSAATVDVAGASEVTGSGNVTVGAHSNAGATAKATANPNANNPSADTAKDAAIARAKMISRAITHVSDSAISAGSTFSLISTNVATTLTTADGSSAGANAAGATVAIADITADTQAFADGASSINAGLIRVSANSNTTATTKAKATSKAVQAPAANQPATTAQTTLANNNAKTDDGPIAFAASVGVTTLNDKTLAYLASSAPITALGDLRVDSRSVANSSVVVDSTTASTGKGEGGAVAIQHATASNRAYLSGSGQVSATGVTVTATTPNSPTLLDAQAISGVSKKNSSIEGAASFNINSVSNEAFLSKGSNVDAKTGDLTISAKGDVIQTASAIPAAGVNPNLPAKGMGASFAVNILSDTTRAELEDNVTLKNAKKLDINADGHEALTTTVQSGADPSASGGSFSGFAAAAGLTVLNATTTARVRTQTPKLEISGDLNLAAKHRAEVSNQAGGNPAGAGVSGAAIALNVVSSQTTATLASDLDAPTGNVAISSNSDLSSSAQATALTRGGKNKSQVPANGTVDKQVGAQIAQADAQASAAGVSGTNNPSKPSAKTGDGSATLAGALAVNLVTNSKSEATILPGKKLTAGGDIALTSTNDTDAGAKADASAASTNSGIGAGIAINVVSGESNRANVGSGATITGKSLKLDAYMSPSGDANNVLRSEATSGAGAKETGVAGSIAINVAKLTTEAAVGSGTQVTLTGGDLTVNATGKTSSPVSARPALDLNTGSAKGVGVSFALDVIEDATRAEVENGASIGSPQNVTVNAASADDISTTAITGVQATSSAYAAAAAITALTAPTTARIGTGTQLTGTGNVSISASHGGLESSNAYEAAASNGSTLGASVAVTVATVETSANLARNIDIPGSLSITSKSTSASEAIAKASSKGGKADNGSSQGATDSEGQADLKQADDAAGSIGAQGTNNAKAPKAENSSGGAAFAGAFALDIVTSSKSEATISPGLIVKAGGLATIAAQNDTDAHASADGSATSANSTGVGVGIALNVAPQVVTRALIGGSSQLKVGGLDVHTSMTSPGGKNTLGADALAGAGAKETGVAGAIAINIAKLTNEAAIGFGTNVEVTGQQDLSVASASSTASNVSAKPLFDGATGSTKGIGASFGLNIVEDSTRAEIENAVQVTGANDITVTAASEDVLINTVQTGAQSTNGGTAFGAAIGLSVLTALTTARVGIGATLQLGDDLAITATHAGSSIVTAGAASASSDTAIGASFAMNFTKVETVASVNRNVNAGGDITISAESASAGDATAVASGKGGKTAENNTPSDAVDTASKSEQYKADSQAAAQGVQGTNNASTPKAKNDQGMTAAGAFALNVALASKAEATIPANLQIGAGGTIQVAARNDTDAHAKADGSTTDAASTGVGVGIAINVVPESISRASVGVNTHLNAHNLVVHAETGHGVDVVNTIGAEAVSGAGAKKTGFGGALAINVAKVTTEAFLDSGTVTTLTNGDLDLTARQQTSSTATATPFKDATGEDKGVGVSAAFNILEDNTRAEVVNSAQINNAHQVTLRAASGDTLVTKAEAGAQSTGDTAFAGSLAATALTTNTKARIGSGAQLVTTGDVILEATHQDTIDASAGGKGQGTKKAIGVAIGFTYESTETTTTTDRGIQAGGNVSFASRASSASNTTAFASESGGKAQQSGNAAQQSDQSKDALDEKAGEGGVKGTAAGTSTPDAKTSNGDSVAFAGAIAVELVPKSHVTATIPNGMGVTAGGSLSLEALNDLDAHAKASGEAKGKADSGYGVGIALTVVPDAQTLATIGKFNPIDAHGVSLHAGMSSNNDGKNIVGAEAVSGASGGDTAGAGAFALTLFTPNTSATIDAASSLELHGGDLSLIADEITESTTTAVPGTNPNTAKTSGYGLSFAFNIIEPTTSATLASTVPVNHAGNVTLSAASNDKLTTEASAGITVAGGGNGGGNGGGGSGTSITGSGAASALTSSTVARLGAGQDLKNAGSITVQATHKDVVTTEAGTKSTADGTAFGISFGLTYESVETLATTDRNLDATGPITFLAHNASSTSATALASVTGAENKGSSTGVKDSGDANKNALDSNAKTADPDAKGVNSNVQSPDAKNADNDSMTVAGAIALDLPFKVHAEATIPAHHTVKSGELLTLDSMNDVDAVSKADGTAVGQSSTGVGVAVAITIAPDVTNFATIGDHATINAKGVHASALNSNDPIPENTLRADATSGGSASDKAGSGAFAMDIFLAKSNATLGHDSFVDAGGGDVTLTAFENTTSNVNAVPAISQGGPGHPDRGANLGVGIAVALNIVEVGTHATIEDSVSVLNAHDVALSAESHDSLNTTATAGNSSPNVPDDSTGVGAEAAISVLLAKTDATIGALGTVNASHDISARAKHSDYVTTTGNGNAAGSGSAYGIAIGIAYVDSQTAATVSESITAGNDVTFDADNSSSTATSATASAKGAKDKKDGQTPNNGVDVTGQNNRDLADSYATQNGGQATDSNQKNPSAQTTDGSLSVAGALALNIVAHSSAKASTADNQFVHTNGALSVTAENDTDAYAAASGVATEASTTGVGIAVALNIAPNVEASATIGKNADIKAHGIAVSAGMSTANDQTNFVGASATSGASASEKGGAGGLGLSIFLDKVHAEVGQGAKLDAKGGDVAIQANSSTNSINFATPAKTGGKTTGVGVSFAVGVIQDQVHAELADNVSLLNADDLIVSAHDHSSLQSTAEAGAQATGGSAGAGGVALSILTADTAARVGVGTDITTTGLIEVSSSHDGGSSATIDSQAGGAKTVVGASIAINYIDSGTTADIHRNMTAGKSFTISAHEKAANSASAAASTSGAASNQAATLEQQKQDQRNYANTQTTSNGGQATQTNENTGAKTSEGNINIAAALGLNIVHTHSEATLPDGLKVKAGGPLTVSAWNDSDGSAFATGKATGDQKTGVGVAVAINFVESSAHALIGQSTVQAKGVKVEATQGGPNEFEAYSANAISGASAKQTGFAGAVALNLVGTNTHDARISHNAQIDAKSGDVEVRAASVTTDTATALPDGGGNASGTGVGASAAVNIVLKNTKAEVEDDVNLANVGAFAVSASSKNTIDTEARNGAQGNQGVGVSAAVLYIEDIAKARVGVGPEIHASGPASITASFDDQSTNKVDSAAIGSETAVGLAIGVDIMRPTATAELNRSLYSTGSIDIKADGVTKSNVDVQSSAVGLPKQVLGVVGKNSDQRTSDQFGYADSLSGKNEQANTPSTAQTENDNSQLATSNTNGQTQSQTSVGVAASIAVSYQDSTISATVADGLTVSGGGKVSVTTGHEVDAITKAESLSLVLSSNTDDTTAVAAAVAVDIPIVHSTAKVGANSHVIGNGIDISARQHNGTFNDFRSQAISGAASTGDGGAGAASLIVSVVQTEALVGANSVLFSTDSISVVAQSPVHLNNSAFSGAVGLGKGVGVSIVLNIIKDRKTEAIIGHDSTIDASGPITVSASSSITPVVGSDPADVVIGFAGSKDTAVGGSIILEYVEQTTRAIIEANTRVNGNTQGLLNQHVSVLATSAFGVSAVVGGAGVSGGSGVGVGLFIVVPKLTTTAEIQHDARVYAGGDVVVKASTTEDYWALSVAGGLAAEKSVAVSAVVFVPEVFTTADIGEKSHVTAQGSVIVGALHDINAQIWGGVLSIGGGNASVGAELSMLALSATTDAYIGQDSVVLSRGKTASIDIPTGYKLPNGNLVVEPVRGVSVTAVAFEKVETLAVGGAISDGTAVSGSAAINYYELNTRAHIDRNTTINASNNLPGSGPSVHVIASDQTDLKSIAGAAAGGSNAGVGIGVDVGVINKNTKASIIGSLTNADTDVIVKANSSESILSISATLAASGNAAVAGSAGVYVINVSTRAFIGYDASDPLALAGPSLVNAWGNVKIGARESLSIIQVTGSVSASGSAAVGAGASVPIVSKTTEAFLGAGSTIFALGYGNAIDVDTGEFGVVWGDYGQDLDQAHPSSQKTGADNSIDKNGDQIPTQRLDHERITAPITKQIHGAAITATNRDELQLVAASAGAAGSVAVNVSGVVNVLTNNTTAHVDTNAAINPSLALGSADQSVEIAAGNDLSYLGFAAGLSVAGTAAITAGANVLVAKETTLAYVSDRATVNARRDISVEAHATEDILSIVVTASGAGTAAVSGGASVLVIDNITRAHIGDVAGSDADGARSTAGGNIVVEATDNTSLIAVAGGVAVGGGAGLGGSVGVTVLGKTTEAYLGSHSTVNAGGNSSSLTDVLSGLLDANGNFTRLAAFHGLEVQAESSEDVFQLAAAGGVGFYVGLGGGITVELFNSNTNAYVGQAANVNTDQALAVKAQGVSVAAGNRVKDFSFGGGLGVGAVGVAGGFDIGIVRNNISATIYDNAEINALDDINVITVSEKDITTFGVSGAGGLVGIALSVCYWSIGSDFDSNYSVDQKSDNAIDTNQRDQALTKTDGVSSGFKDVTSSYLNTNNNSALKPASHVDKAKTGSDKSINNNAQGGQVLGAINAPLQPLGTASRVHGGVKIHAGGDVHIHALDHLKLGINAGGVAVGFVGAGGAIAIVNVHESVSAIVDPNVSIDALGSVSVAALYSAQYDAFVLEGSIGAVALGAQVIIIEDLSTQVASIGANTQITRAANVFVAASATRQADTETIAVSGGIAAVGVTYVDVTLGGSTIASVSAGVQIGEAAPGPVNGDVIILATQHNEATMKGYAFSLGLAAGAGNHSSATIKPLIGASVADNVGIKANGNIKVQADSVGNAEADLLNIGAGGLVITVMISDVELSPTVLAVVGSSSDLTAGGSITISASHNYGASGPLANHGVRAHSEAPSGGALSGSGVSTKATANAITGAAVQPNAHLHAGGDIAITSSLSNQASAKSDTYSVGAIGVGVSDSTATAKGMSLALLYGSANAGGVIQVQSLGASHADAEATALAIAAVGAAEGANTTAIASPAIQAAIGDGQNAALASANKGVNLIAASEGDAHARTNTIVGSGLVSYGKASSHAELSPTVQATVGKGSDVSAALGSLKIAATHAVTNKLGALAESWAPGASGLVSLTGSDATATAAATVAALVDTGATIQSRVDIDMSADSTNNATAKALAVAVGGVAGIGTSSSNATASGKTTAFMDGRVLNTTDFSLTSKGTDVAVSDANVAGGGLVGGVGASSHATSTPTVATRVGVGGNVQSNAQILSKGGVTISSASYSSSDAQAHTTTVGGLGAFGLVDATAFTKANTTTDVNLFSIVKGGGDIQILSSNNADQRVSAHAMAEAPGTISAGVSGTGAKPTATSSSITRTFVGDRVVVSTPGDILIGAVTSGHVAAEAKTLSLGFAALGTTTVAATSNGETTTQMDASVSGHDVTILSGSFDTATTTGTSLSAGIIAGQGVTTTSLVNTKTLAQIGEPAFAGSVHATGNATLGAVALETSSAEAKTAVFSGLGSIGLSHASATMSSSVGAVVWNGHSIVADGNIQVSAILSLPANQLSASAHAEAPGGGLLSVQGAWADAVATPHVYATANVDSTLNAGGDISVQATSTTTANAEVSSLSLGALSFAATFANAEASALTEASMLGTIEMGRNLTVEANGTDTAHGHSEAAAVGFGAGDGAFVNTQVRPKSIATLGTAGDLDSHYQLSNDITIRAKEWAVGTSEAGAFAFGFIGVGVAETETDVVPFVSAVISQDAVVRASGDITINADFDGDQSTSAAHATGDGALAGIQSTTATLKMSPIVGATAQPGSSLFSGGNVTFLAHSHSDGASQADGTSIAIGVGAGATNAETQIGGVTLAGTANASTIVARHDVSVIADDKVDADSHAYALGAGVAGGAGATASSKVVKQVIADLDTNGGSVIAFGAVLVNAKGDNNLTSKAEGSALGLGAMGLSDSLTDSTLTVTSLIGPDTQVTARDGVTVDGYGHSYMNSQSNSSSGGLAGGIEGTTSTRIGHVDVEALVSPHVSINAGAIAVHAKSDNNAYGGSDGGAYGGLGVGSQISHTDLWSKTIAKVQDASAAQPNHLFGDTGISINAEGGIDATTATHGGAGGLFGFGGAENYINVHSPLVRASIGNNTTVQSNGDLTVDANDSITLSSTANQGAGGGIAVVDARADAEIDGPQSITVPGEDAFRGELVLTDLGQNVTANVANFKMHSTQKNVKVSSFVDVDAAGVDAWAFADAVANAYNNSIVYIATGTDLTATGDVNLRADGPNHTWTSAHSDAFAYSALPPAAATADSTSEKHSHDCVIVEQGVHFTAVNVDVWAGANPALGPDDQYEKIADALFVIGIVPAPGFSSTPGSQTNEACVDLDADITLLGNGKHVVHIDSQGKIDALEGMVVFQGNVQKFLGQKVTGAFTVHTTQLVGPSGQIRVHATDGETTGFSNITYNKNTDVDIVNNSAFTMTLGQIKNNDGNAPTIIHEANLFEKFWNYSLGAQAQNKKKMKVVDNGGEAGGLILSAPIFVPGTDLILETNGSILVAASQGELGLPPVISAHSIVLHAQGGSIGSVTGLIPVRLYTDSDEPTGLVDVFAAQGVYLDATFIGGEGQAQHTLSNIHAGGGPVFVRLHDSLDVLGNAVKTTWHVGAIGSDQGDLTLLFGSTDGRVDNDVVVDDRLDALAGRILLRTARGAMTQGGERGVIAARGIELDASSVGAPDRPILIDQRTLSGSTERTLPTFDGLANGGSFHARSVAGPMNVGQIQALRGDVDLSTTDTSDQGDDLIIDGAHRVIAPNGNIHLRAGDNVLLGSNALLSALNEVTIEGDADDADPGVGSILEIDGRIEAASLQITTGDDADAVALRSLLSGIRATIATHAGDDAIYLGSMAVAFGGLPEHPVPTRNGGDLQGILGSLTIDAGASDRSVAEHDRLVVEADGDRTSRKVKVTDRAVTGLTGGSSRTAPAGLPITYLNVEALDILLGSGNDSVTVESLARSTATQIDGGDGDDMFTIGNIGSRNEGVPLPLLIGGAGRNSLVGPDSQNLWEITSSNQGVVKGPNPFQFRSVQSLKGGRLDDVFQFDERASLDGTVDGGEGNNSLDFSRFNARVDVDFDAGSVTGVLGGMRGGMSHIDEVILPSGERKRRRS